MNSEHTSTSQQIENTQDSDSNTLSWAEYLTRYDPLKFPEAEALIPINPLKQTAYGTGSIVYQDLKNAKGLINKPIENLNTILHVNVMWKRWREILKRTH